MINTPGAMKAMDDSFSKLSKQGVWDILSVREYDEVVAEVKRRGITTHRGRCVRYLRRREVNSQKTTLAANGKADTSSEAAIFNELSSTPATLEASKAVDAYGLMPDNAIGQCESEQAYVQSELGGTTAWVSLPKERGPESLKSFRRP
eukprot:16248856-Heterocapsa_arctica.AAC.1